MCQFCVKNIEAKKNSEIIQKTPSCGRSVNIILPQNGKKNLIFGILYSLVFHTENQNVSDVSVQYIWNFNYRHELKRKNKIDGKGQMSRTGEDMVRELKENRVKILDRNECRETSVTVSVEKYPH